MQEMVMGQSRLLDYLSGQTTTSTSSVVVTEKTYEPALAVIEVDYSAVAESVQITPSENVAANENEVLEVPVKSKRGRKKQAAKVIEILDVPEVALEVITLQPEPSALFSGVRLTLYNALQSNGRLVDVPSLKLKDLHAIAAECGIATSLSTISRFQKEVKELLSQ